MTRTREAGLLAILGAVAALMACREVPAPAGSGSAAPPATTSVPTTTAPTTSVPPPDTQTTARGRGRGSPPPRPELPETVGADPPGPVPPLPPVGLPAFPWPPPRYSAFATIAREWVATGAEPTLGSAAARLERAFDAAGYGERSYYWVPGGFALVSRIEQIRDDATPLAVPARWAIDTPMVRAGFIDHIRALFNAPPGFYRVIVFAVTDQDFAAGERPPTSSEARTWVSSGSLRLPASVGARPYSAQHFTTALIYEFERRADRSDAAIRAPSNSPGQVHLEKTGLWQALARP
jgi:hypothetical protein